MPKAPNQKLKIEYLRQILLENTDDNHGLTMKEIIQALESYGIKAERKSIYDDIEALKVAGLDIIGEKQGGQYSYYVGTRTFELAELKLLVGAVESAKFITANKSRKLIKKIAGLSSRHEAAYLQRQVYVVDRAKTLNESIYYNVDKIHNAIANNVKVSYQYFEYTVDKKRRYKKDGANYIISPWALTWNDNKYYMIGYDEEAKIMKNYRVDKMDKLELTTSPRVGHDPTQEFKVGEYSKKMFSMYGGEEMNIKLEFENEYIGVVLDRFGQDIIVIPKNDTHFTVNVTIIVSPQFLAWIFSLGSGVKIISPQKVIDNMKNEIERVQAQYQ